VTDEQGFGSVDRQLGVIGAKLESIMDMMRQRAEQAEKQSERMAQDLRTLKHDQRNVEQKVETFGWRQEQLESRVKTVSESLAELREPVEALMQTRTRVAGAMIVIASVGGFVWLMFEAVGRWAIDHFFGGKIS